jgi:hypothetical protein
MRDNNGQFVKSHKSTHEKIAELGLTAEERLVLKYVVADDYPLSFAVAVVEELTGVVVDAKKLQRKLVPVNTTKGRVEKEVLV